MKFKRPLWNPRAILVALFLVMGFWGYVHLISAIITAIHRQQLDIINPYYLIKVNSVFGSFANNGFSFAIGWLVFFAMVVITYKYLRGRERGAMDSTARADHHKRIKK